MKLRCGACKSRVFWLLLVTIVALGVMPGCGSGSDQRPSFGPTPTPPVPLIKLSTDPYSNTQSQHATEVEPGAFAFGSTIVSAFQVGRIFDGGGADIGFATSKDGGATWKNGFLPGITIFEGTGTFSAVSDPSVAYDAAHSVWLISSLPIGVPTQVAVSRSSDGITWSNPIRVSRNETGDADKNWIACDNTASSPNYGRCYVEWDDSNANDVVWMSTSLDGGQTWQPAKNTANAATGLGGEPVVQPNGNVIVPMLEICQSPCTPSILAFSSVNGGASWSGTVAVAPTAHHLVAGNLRTDPLPSVQVDGGGTVYVVWQDCKFRKNCTSNDLVMSTSADGVTWSAPSRIPIDAVSSAADHFLPGLGVDPGTLGSTAHLGMVYYFYPTSDCTALTCQLTAGFISSDDAGQTWSAPTTISIPMALGWLPDTFSGVMVGDYMSIVFSGGKARPIFVVANSPSGSLAFDEAVYTTTNAFSGSVHTRRFSSAGEQPIPGAHSDHERKFYDLEHHHPVTPPK